VQNVLFGSLAMWDWRDPHTGSDNRCDTGSRHDPWGRLWPPRLRGMAGDVRDGHPRRAACDANHPPICL